MDVVEADNRPILLLVELEKFLVHFSNISTRRLIRSSYELRYHYLSVGMVGDYRHNSIFDFLTCYYILHCNELVSV